MENYNPKEPWTTKKGKTLELMMFSDYTELCKWLQQTESAFTGKREKNNYHRHLEWLLKRKGEDRSPVMLCSFCEKNVVQYFTIRFSYNNEISVSPEHTYCHKCVEFAEGPPLPFKFSVLKGKSKQDQEKIISLFKQVFQIKKPLTKKKAFQFFDSKHRN